MSNDSINFMTISELSENIREKKLSPIEIVQELLKTIKKLNPANKSFLYIAEEESIKKAHSIEKEISSGNYKGPLHGIPLSLIHISEPTRPY